MQHAGDNCMRASESAKGIDSIKVPDDVKESVGDVKRQMDEVKDAFKGIKIK